MAKQTHQLEMKEKIYRKSCFDKSVSRMFFICSVWLWEDF